ncbi:zinc carboxypeptidase, partial [Necator americanus]
VTEKPRILIDVWGEPSRQNPVADVLVAPEFLGAFLEMLSRKGVTYVETIKEDIGREIRRERRHLQRYRSRAKRSFDAMDFDVDNYHSYDEMVEFMQLLAAQRPDLVTLLNVSRTFEGRPMYGVKLVSEYGKDPVITRSVDKFDWYIIPQANPDGYEYSRVSDRLWRKTRSRNITVNKWCIGADANRNWGHRWGLRDLVTWQIPNLIIYASLHSYGQLLLSPWGYTQARPDNYLDQVAEKNSRNAAKIAVAAMRNATGAEYNYGTIAELMCKWALLIGSLIFARISAIADPASGTSIDYMQDRGVPYIFGVELRPLDSHDSYAFSLPPHYIRPTGNLRKCLYFDANSADSMYFVLL